MTAEREFEQSLEMPVNDEVNIEPMKKSAPIEGFVKISETSPNSTNFRKMI